MHPLDRPLLLGLIALEREFVSSAELIDAFRAWRNRPDESLGQILAAQGKLSAEKIESLEHYLADSSLGLPTTTQRPGSTPDFDVAEPTRSFLHSRTEARPSNSATALPETSTRFKPVKLHAQGGLGQVFLAEDCELHRQVALKEIQPDAADDPISRRRFVAEAEITGNLEHPGVVPVYGLGVHADGRPFYAMRFIQGENLSVAIKKFYQSGRGNCASLDFRNLLTRLIGVCNAVAFAHSRNVIHRDLKPSNVMLGPFGETLVVDWGLAKQLVAADDETLAPRGRTVGSSDLATSAGEVIGTPAFMSPEQARGNVREVGPASDIYSLGAILHFLLTGHSPPRASSSESADSAASPEAQPNRVLVARAPRALAAICSKAMADDPHDRYASALDLAADIERWLADERPIAHAEPWTDTAFRWVRKNRLPVAVATALLLATSVALSVGYVLVSKQRDIAEGARRDALAANVRARENAAAARNVIEEYLIRVGDERWSNIPGFEGVRIDMANLAVERYRELLRQQPNDQSLVADRAMALRRSANLYRMVGQNEAAEKLYDESVDQLKKVATGPEPLPKYEQWLCETLCDRALLVARVSGPKAAIEPMREALNAGRQLVARQPTSIAARQATARVEGDLADLLLQVGQFDEAVRLARSAAVTLQKAADENSRPLANRLTAAFSGVNLGATLHEARLPADAEKVLHQTLERTNAYVKQSPMDANLRYIQARCQHELALVHVRAKELDKAGAEFREALASLAKLTEEFPKVISFRRKLAQALTDNARLDFSRGEQQVAVEGVRRSIELLEQLDPQQELPAMQELLASACLLAGKIELQRNDVAAARTSSGRAREALEKARKFNPDSPVLAEEAKRLELLLTALGG